ncbi:hypothetical protein [Paractinoplanes globisporus]|uniref:Lipoprotein n=1 Tax=Paractinoplanes globisporus TaxID=113565 RepID=A0ABW6W997_9ACTN|nr:hypothetical protein [Actinoplanes globisporus]
MKKIASTVLLTALVVAGCSGGGGAGSPNPSASAAAGRQQLLALGQEWVQCLRTHGLTRMPDAQLTQDGYLQFPPAGNYNWKSDLSTHKSIIEACQPIEDRYPPNAFRPKQQLTADDLRKLAEYAKCVRAHGVPDFPDPNQAGEFDVAGTSVERGMSKQMNDQIDQACRSVWSGDVKITGGSNEKSGGKK